VSEKKCGTWGQGAHPPRSTSAAHALVLGLTSWTSRRSRCSHDALGPRSSEDVDERHREFLTGERRRRVLPEKPISSRRSRGVAYAPYADLSVRDVNTHLDEARRFAEAVKAHTPTRCCVQLLAIVNWRKYLTIIDDRPLSKGARRWLHVPVHHARRLARANLSMFELPGLQRADMTGTSSYRRASSRWSPTDIPRLATTRSRGRLLR